jgi:hypothetical protein
MSYETYNDFIRQFLSIERVCDVYKLEIENIINLIGKYINNTLEKIKNVHNDLYEEFIRKITTFNLEYTGSMTKIEFYDFYFKCKNNMLTINNSRNIINMLWSFIKIIVSNIIFIGTTKNIDEDYITFKSQILNGINYLGIYMDFDQTLLHKIINDCFQRLELHFGIENVKTINQNQFYKYVIRLSLLNPRLIADQQKCDKPSGFIIDKIYQSSDTFRLAINKYFLETELDYINRTGLLPFVGSAIGSVNVDTNYFRFCSINNIYSVCGLSGSTFELMMYVLIFNICDNDNQENLKGLMALFLHFHLMRGTHSDLEVVCAFVKISEWFPCLMLICNTIVGNNMITFNYGKLSENLLLGFKSDNNKLKYRFA